MFNNTPLLKKFVTNPVHALRGYTAATLLVLMLGTAISPGVAMANKCTASNNSEFAMVIAGGHAFDKHVGEFEQGKEINGLAFAPKTIANKEQFAIFLEHILDTTLRSKSLSGNRHAYWDSTTGTIIITDPSSDDCGSAFRPSGGKDYYKKQR